MQLIAGIGVPVELEYESVTIGYVLKAEYFLPDNTTIVMHFLQDPFNPIPHPITNRRRRDALLAARDAEGRKSHDPIEDQVIDVDNNHTSKDHYEKYDVEAIEIDAGLTGNDDEDEDPEYNGWDEGDEDDNDEYAPADYRMTKPNDLSTARWTLFKGIEMLAER